MSMNLTIKGVGMRVGGPPAPHSDMLYAATREALEDARLRRDQIDTAVTIASDFAEGRGLANQWILDAIGGTMRPFDLRLGNESLWGIAAGALQLLAGDHRTAIIAGVWRASDLMEAAEFGRLLAARANPFYERPLLGRLNGNARAALSELLNRSDEDVEGSPPPLEDVAVSIVLERGEDPSGVVLEGIGWHQLAEWDLENYRRSVLNAAEAAFGRAGGRPELSWVEIPGYPAAVSRASRDALGVTASVAVNPSGSGEVENVMMDGLRRLALATRMLRESSPGTSAAVQSWQGPMSSSTAVAVVSRR